MTDLMTVKEAADYLGRTEASLRWQIQANGDIPPHAKIGSRICFRRSLIDKWLDDKFAAAAKETA